ncbi:CDC73-domain-containing protein [Anaeromyces robustus]|uniref:CDC73-domain-containing protein n=1 Tax=Anaeromyces robustus TaxID=1754192 RepID=A0A1Y1WY83_9FUNG|nr:CDC73-domain-containing protein [Anaeromyces robustus]|eukprot:ORX78511.1 CDC73-domain-containing protein [Anaeromyces robustus]
MSEAIVLLRKSILEKVPYQLSNADHVKVDNIKDATYITIYDKEFNLQDPSQYKNYNLATVLFLYKNQNLDHSSYFQESIAVNNQAISIIEKKGILDYLNGQTNKLDDLEGKDGDKNEKEKRGASEIESEDKDAKKQKINENEEDIEPVKQITSRERTLQNRKSILQSRGTKSFETVHKIANEVFLSADKAKKKSEVSDKKMPQIYKGHAKPHEHGTPIIIVPSAPTSLITMYNIRQFLEDKQFLEPQECRRQGVKKEQRLTITRTRSDGKGELKYYVVDSVDRFQDAEWSKVVAVFTCGASWQFKGWKWSNPTELFSKVRGFYLQYQDDILKEPVKDWNVKVLKIEKNKRHHDIQTVLEFWNELDRYMGSRV